MIKNKYSCLFIFLFLFLHCGTESKEPNFERPPFEKHPTHIIQPGVTGFRIVAPQPQVRIFQIDENKCNAQTIKGNQFAPVVVKLKMKIDRDGKATIIYRDYPKGSIGTVIEDIVASWSRWDHCKMGTIKYLINIGGHEFKVDPSGLQPLPEFINDIIENGNMGLIDDYFKDVNLNFQIKDF